MKEYEGICMNVPYHYVENHIMKVYQMIRNDLVYVLSKKKNIYIYIVQITI